MAVEETEITNDLLMYNPSQTTLLKSFRRLTGMKGVDDAGDGGPNRVDFATNCLPEEDLDPYKGILDRIEVGVAGRQVTLIGAGSLGHLVNPQPNIARQIVRSSRRRRP